MTKNLSLYLHIPFCLKKCDYCDFYSITDYSHTDDFIDSLINELDIYSNELHKPTLNSIFFGGGTPSSLNINQFERIYSAIKEKFAFEPNCEITIECNPASAYIEKLKKYFELGVNRISIGVQSFIDNELKLLGRLHSAKTAENFILNSSAIGFNSISIDLIIALPNQKIQDVEYSINKALNLPIEHISAYTLIIEPDTPIYDKCQSGALAPISEELEAEYYSYICNRLINNGYEQYEISNFAKNGKYSFHNLNYWNVGSYIGVGPSAHGFIQTSRYSNYSDIKKYIEELQNKRLPIEEKIEQSLWDLISEEFFLRLRAQGINYKDFYFKYQIDLKSILTNEIEMWINEQFLYDKKDIMELMLKGRIYCDEISAICLKSIEKEFIKLHKT